MEKSGEYEEGKVVQKGSTLVMGIDVDIRVFVAPTDELLSKLRALNHPVIWSVNAVNEGDIAAMGNEEKPHIHIQSACRYYGPAYRRGNWPDIRDALFAIREECPPGTVWYGGDYREWHVPTDDWLFARLDAVWEKYGADY